VTQASTAKKPARHSNKPTLRSLGLIEEFRAIDYDFAEEMVIEIPARSAAVENLTADDLRAIALTAIDRAAAAKEEQRAFDSKSWLWSHYETIRRRMGHIGLACDTLADAMEEHAAADA
jgi:hypothetical protein